MGCIMMKNSFRTQKCSYPNAFQMAKFQHSCHLVRVRICFSLYFYHFINNLVKFVMYIEIRFLLLNFPGPRRCIGSLFAKYLVRTALVVLLQHFEFLSYNHTQKSIEYSSTKNTLVPKDGIWINIKRIE